MAASTIARTLMPPPTLGLLPQRQARARGMFASIMLHAVAVPALIWLPVLFPSPIVVRTSNVSKPVAATDLEPLVAPGLPQLPDSGPGSLEPARGAPGVGSGPPQPPADPSPQKPDYIGPQEIISYVPNPVNRVQTIRRLDLVQPPDIKFPVRLQNMVNLPVAAAPVLTVPPRPEPAAVAATPEEVPIAEAAVPNPALTLIPKQVSAVPSEVTPLQTMPSLPLPAEPQANAPKVVVVNAVNVPPDPAAVVPDAQLAGHFVVGPSPVTGATEKSSAAGTGRAAGPSNSSGVSSRPWLESGSGSSSGNDHTTGTGGGNRTETGTGVGLDTDSRNASSAGTGGGAGSSSGAGSGSGAPGRGAGNGSSTGISISGGVPGRNRVTIAKALPMRRSYGMMIISGGSSGGASRDVGVFDRSETVYSVTIPMADTGGGPDWTMQYALLNRVQTGASLLVPPFVRKKVAATMAKSQLVGEPGPVFISGTIDESGKLESLRAIRAQDARSQPAIRALQQWEFQPAQLDGRPVASKVLIGVTVTVAN